MPYSDKEQERISKARYYQANKARMDESCKRLRKARSAVRRASKPTDEQRFEFNLNKASDGCWIWTGNRTNKGYGRFTHHPGGGPAKRELAHRYSYKRWIGDLPDDLLVCHKCDVPLCVNPDHLFLGNEQDNSSDMVAKGRQCRGKRRSKISRGELNPAAKLTQEDVAYIRASYKPTVITMQMLAEEKGISKATIADIIYRRSWV